ASSPTVRAGSSPSWPGAAPVRLGDPSVSVVMGSSIAAPRVPGHLTRTTAGDDRARSETEACCGRGEYRVWRGRGMAGRAYAAASARSKVPPVTQDQDKDKETAGPLPGSETGLPGRGRPQTDRVVFGVTAALTLAFVLWGAVWTDSLEDVSASALSGLIHNGGWAFMLAASGFVVFALWLAARRDGRIHLGAEGEEPEFRTVSWVAMMFSAGMGIGLMFYGVSEPLAHYVDAPPGTDPADSGERMEVAMATTLFHWTLHPWAIYAVVGLAIAYSPLRRRRRQTISAVFTPLIGEKASNGIGGRVIDMLAIIATIFGSAASLGLGALQIGSGVQELGWLEKVSTGLLVSIIAVLTLAFVASAVSGVEKGIQWLSNTNMVLALILALFVFAAGPTIVVLDLIPTSVFSYLGELPQLAGRTEASGGGGVADWLGSWTV